MKKLFFLGFCLSTLHFSAQQKTKRLLPNEIPLSSFENRKSSHHYKKYTSQVFIHTKDYGKFRISINDQIIENATGNFRFYNLESGEHTLSIFENNLIIYKTKIFIKENHRLVLEFVYNEGLFIINELTLGPKPPENTRTQTAYRYQNTMSDEDFNQFLVYFKKQGFDHKKLEVFSTLPKFIFLNTQQIIQLIKAMDFDKNKLNLAKSAYDHCTDPYNYYKVGNSFNFPSYQRELNEFLSKKQK